MNGVFTTSDDALTKLKETLINLDLDEIEPLTIKALQSHDAREVLKALTDGMLKVGELYETKEYYLPELVLAGECMETGLKILKPHLKADEGATTGKVVAATVKGDLHDIGKNIVVTLLTAAGFEVIDLGKDVPAEAVVEAVRSENPDIVALSALLTMTVVEIEEVAKQLREAGLRDKVTIMVGGAPLNQELAEKLGADYSCDDAVEGVRLARKLVAEKVKA
ncbi:MAG: corrinoid protein [Promethearchaeota archaeon]